MRARSGSSGIWFSTSPANARIEQLPRLRLAQTPRAQVEDRVVVHLADGRAVRALDVVGEDLELRVGVDLGILGQEQRLVRLLGVGLLRVGPDDDLAVEDGAGAVRQDALVDLAAAAVRLRVIDRRVIVDEAGAVAEIEAVQRARAPSPSSTTFDVVAHERAAEADRMAGDARVPARRATYIGLRYGSCADSRAGACSDAAVALSPADHSVTALVK